MSGKVSGTISNSWMGWGMKYAVVLAINYRTLISYNATNVFLVSLIFLCFPDTQLFFSTPHGLTEKLDKKLEIQCGVLQGSIFDPLFSNIFAGDKIFYYSNDNFWPLFAFMNDKLEKVVQQFNVKKISQNTNKKSYNFFHKPTRKKMRVCFLTL